MEEKNISWTDKIPVLGWVVIIPLVIAAGLGVIIFTFYAIATIEGVASLVLFVTAFFTLRFAGMTKDEFAKEKLKGSKRNRAKNLFLACSW